MSARKLILTVSVLFVLIAAGFAPRSGAQIATVNVADPANPQVSYDEDPYAPEPYVPGDPTTVYTEGVPPGSDPAASALALARIVTSTQANVADPFTSQAPVVKTSNPDTYSLSAPTVYYTPPFEPSGPFVQHGAHLKFDFGPGALEPGYTRVLASTAYGPETGYGWGDTSKVIERDRGGSDELENDFCLPSGTQFYVDLPEGNYHVSLLTGDRIGRTRMAVRAEGLLQLYNMQTPTGKFLQDSFTVHVRDGRLMLEFIGTAPFVNAVEITRIPDDKPRKPTVFVASDSTAASYYQYSAPMAGWGHYLADYFDDGVAVDNQAKASRSSKSFYEEGSLATIEDRIRPGDYLFVMFAINDSADDSSNRKTRPESTFKAYLRLYVNSARSRGATPVFVTSQTKRTFDVWGKFTNSVGTYPQAMRELGAELNVPVIDLNKKSIEFFTSIGPEATKRSFMYLVPGEHPNYPNGLSDYIHFQETGAKQLAKLVVEGVKELGIKPLAQHVVLEPDTAPPAL